MAIAASEARAQLSGPIGSVDLENIEVEITSRHGSAILMSDAEYDSLAETAHLLHTSSSAQRLLSAIGSARSGGAGERQVLER